MTQCFNCHNELKDLNQQIKWNCSKCGILIYEEQPRNLSIDILNNIFNKIKDFNEDKYFELIDIYNELVEYYK